MRQINLIGDPKTGKLNFFNNENTTSIDIKQYNQHLIEVQAINASGTGITAYRPGPINTFSTFKPNENYIAIAKGGFSITLPTAPAVSRAASTANFAVKGNATAQRGKPTIFVYPYARPQLISKYNAQISLVYSPNSTNTFLRSYRPFSTSNGFEAFEQGKGYIVFAREDFVIENPDVVQPIPTPSRTPVPTSTQVPTPTPWPSPTPYPGCTVKPPLPPPPTPVPGPTNTPVPTNTPRPSPTPLPSSTPAPTSTPISRITLTGPTQAREGDVITFVISNSYPRTSSVAWTIGGPGINVSDLSEVNGVTPTSLGGTALYDGSGVATVTLKFAKDGLTAGAGFETFTFTVDGGTEAGVSRTCAVYDYIPPAPLVDNAQFVSMVSVPDFVRAYGPETLTNEEAQAYLDRYVDLRNAFGATNIAAAKTHWVNHGRREYRDGSIAGRTYPVRVRMKNTGTTTWTSGGANPYRLGSQNPQDNGNWGTGRVELPNSVAPGQEVEFVFTANATNIYPGTANFSWRMVRELITWFGETATDVVNVGQAAPLPTPTATAPAATPLPTPSPTPRPITPTPTPTIVPTSTPTPTPLPPTRMPEPTPVPPTTYDIEMPAQANEGDVVTINFVRRGPNVGSTTTRPWALYGTGIVLADFTRINGATPTALNGFVVLTNQGTTNGVTLYRGSITVEFKKDKLKAIGGFETLNVQITNEATNFQYVESLRIMDKVVGVNYEIAGRNDTIEKVTLTQTITKRNASTRAAFLDIPWDISGARVNLNDFAQINDVKPTALSGLFRLYPTSTTSLNENGGYNYSANFTINFTANKDKTPGGKETISLRFSPSDAPAFNKSIDIFDNPPAVYYEILGPGEGNEGETINFTINRKGGGQISSTRTATWSVNGTGITLSDFARINGTSPARLNGTLELKQTGVFNNVGGKEYQDLWQFQFAKNKDNKVRGGFESFTFKVDDADSKTASKTIKIYDKAPPPTPLPVESFRISGPSQVMSGRPATYTITGYNIPPGQRTISYSFINKRIPGSPASGPAFGLNVSSNGNLTFAGTGAYRTETVTFTVIPTVSRILGRKSMELIVGMQAAAYATDIEPEPAPTPTPTPPPPPPVQPVLAALTPTGPGRPCVGTRPNCTNGSVRVTHRLGSISGIVQTSVTVYVNDRAAVSRNYAGSSTGTNLEIDIPGLTGGQTYSIKVMNDAKQVTGAANVTIPAYV